MSSPLYNSFGNKPQPNNMFQMMQQFRQFSNSFKGDPKAKVQELLNSGKMSQSQYNDLCNKAQQFKSFLGIK